MQLYIMTSGDAAASLTVMGKVYDALGLPAWLINYDQILFLALFALYFILRKALTGNVFSQKKEGLQQFVEKVSKVVLSERHSINNKLKPILVSGLYFSIIASVFAGGFLLLSDRGTLGHSYLMSFSASLAEDVFFFGVVGIALTYLTVRNPGEDHPEVRIGYLLNSDMVSENVRNAVFETISPHLIYCKKLYIKANIVDYCEELGAVRVEILSTSYFFNTISDKKVVDDKAHFILNTDNLKIDKRKHGRFSSNGAITSLKFRFGKNDRYRDEIVTDKMVDDIYEHPVSIYCNGGESYESIYTYWVWHQIGKEHYWKTKRFVDELVLNIKNETQYDIRFKCLLRCGVDDNGEEPCEELLTPDTRKEYSFRELKPNHHRLFELMAVENKRN